jgi:putative transposase
LPFTYLVYDRSKPSRLATGRWVEAMAVPLCHPRAHGAFPLRRAGNEVGGVTTQSGVLLPAKTTASGRVTQRASSDPACIPAETTEAPPCGKAPWARKEEPRHAWQSLSQVRWECKSHVVMIPKYRRTVFDGKLGRPIGRLLREWCRPRGVELVEGQAMPDPIPLCLSIPPKSRVAFPIGLRNGKSAVGNHRERRHERRMRGLHFGAAGSGVSTVGLDEARVRQSIRENEVWERRQGELDLE